jgi:hypothetical protein
MEIPATWDEQELTGRMGEKMGKKKKGIRVKNCMLSSQYSFSSYFARKTADVYCGWFTAEN